MNHHTPLGTRTYKASAIHHLFLLLAGSHATSSDFRHSWPPAASCSLLTQLPPVTEGGCRERGGRMRYLVAAGLLLVLATGCGLGERDDKKCGEACGINFGEQTSWCDGRGDCVHAGGDDSGPPVGFCG